MRVKILPKSKIKFPKFAIFQTHFSLNFTRQGYPNLRWGCREKIREYPHVRLRSGRFCLGGVLAQKRKKNTDLNTWSVFPGIFFLTKKNSQKVPTRCPDRYSIFVFAPKWSLNLVILTSKKYGEIPWFFLYSPVRRKGTLIVQTLEKRDFENLRFWKISINFLIFWGLTPIKIFEQFLILLGNTLGFSFSPKRPPSDPLPTFLVA